MLASRAQSVAVLLPLAICLVTTLFTIVIHGLALTSVVNFVRRERHAGRAGVRFWIDLVIVGGATVLALTAHLMEVTIWALVLILCGEFAQFGAAFYESAMNYTSLGYGDVVMSVSWKLLAPLETADGMLMFGLSTGMIFAVVLRLVQSRFPDLDD
jgi:Ion channel